MRVFGDDQEVGRDFLKIDWKLIFLMGDQPSTCPRCGSRTDMLSNLFHTNLKLTIEECLNPVCRYMFLLQEDQDGYDFDASEEE